MTAQTQTFTGWLLAQIADDEAVARTRVAIFDALPSHERAAAEAVRASLLGGEAWDMPTFAPDPARVLATCAAHRRIVELHGEMDGGAPETYPYVSDDGRTIWPGCAVCDEGSPRRPYCDTIRALAAIYADRPGWREEWAL